MAQVNLYDYLDQIRDLLDQEHYTQAALHCHHILRQYPRHVETYRLLGQALLEQSSYQEASDLFLRILSVDPEDFVAHVGLSQIAKSDADYRRAIWHIERASDIRPNNEPIEEERRNLYDLAKVELPESAGLTQAAVARIYMRSGMYQQAISDLNSLLQDQPNRLDARVLLAETYWAADKGGEASNQANKVLDFLPDSYKAHAILADVWMQKEEMGHARPHLDKLGDILLPDKRFLDADTPSGRALTRADDDILLQAILIDQADVAVDDVSLIGGSDSWRGQTGLLRSDDFDIDDGLGEKAEDFEWLSFDEDADEPSMDDETPSAGDSDFLSLLADDGDPGYLTDDLDEDVTDISDEDDAAFMAFLDFDDSEEPAAEAETESAAATPSDDGNSDEGEIDFLDALMAEDDEPETMESSAPSWLSEEEERADNELGRTPTWLLDDNDLDAAGAGPDDLYQAILSEDDTDQSEVTERDADDWFAALEGGAGATDQNDDLSWDDALNAMGATDAKPATQETDEVPDWLATTSGVAISDDEAPDWAQDFLTESAEQNRSGEEGLNDWIIGLEETEDTTEADTDNDLADIFATAGDELSSDDFLSDSGDSDFATLFDSPGGDLTPVPDVAGPDGDNDSLDWLLGDTPDDGLISDDTETEEETEQSLDWLLDSQSALSEDIEAGSLAVEDGEASSGFTGWLDSDDATTETEAAVVDVQSESTGFTGFFDQEDTPVVADEPGASTDESDSSGFTAFLELDDASTETEAPVVDAQSESTGFTGFFDQDSTPVEADESVASTTDESDSSGFTAFLELDDTTTAAETPSVVEADSDSSGFTAFLDLESTSDEAEQPTNPEDNATSEGFTDWLSLDGEGQTDTLSAIEANEAADDFADWLSGSTADLEDDTDSAEPEDDFADWLSDSAADLEGDTDSAESEGDFAAWLEANDEAEDTVDTDEAVSLDLVTADTGDDTSSGFTGWLDGESDDDDTSTEEDSVEDFFAAAEDSGLLVQNEAGFSDWLSGLDETSAEEIEEPDTSISISDQSTDNLADDLIEGLLAETDPISSMLDADGDDTEEDDVLVDDWLASVSASELDEAAADADLSWLGISDDDDASASAETLGASAGDGLLDIAELIPSSETEFDDLFVDSESGDDTAEIEALGLGDIGETEADLAELDDTLFIEDDIEGEIQEAPNGDGLDDDMQIGLTDWLTDLSAQGLDDTLFNEDENEDTVGATGFLDQNAAEPIPTWLLGNPEEDDSATDEEQAQLGESWLSLLAEDEEQQAAEITEPDSDTESIDDLALPELSDLTQTADPIENEPDLDSTDTEIDAIVAEFADTDHALTSISEKQEYVTDGDVPLPSWLVTATDEIDLHQVEEISDKEMAAAVARVTQANDTDTDNEDKSAAQSDLDAISEETSTELEAEVDDFAWVTIDTDEDSLDNDTSGDDPLPTDEDSLDNDTSDDDPLPLEDEELATQLTEVDEKVPTMSDLEDTLAFLEQLARTDIDSSKKKKEPSSDVSPSAEPPVAKDEKDNEETLSWLDGADDSSSDTSLDLEEPPTLSWTTKNEPVSLDTESTDPAPINATDDAADDGALGWLDEWAETPIDETTLFAEPIPGLDDIVDEDLDDLASALDDLELPEDDQTEGKETQAGDDASESPLLDFSEFPEGDDLLGLDDLEANLDLGIDSDSFEVPDDPDELIAWLGGEDAVEAEPDALDEMENLLVEAEPEPEPEPVAPPPPPKAEKKKKSGGMFGGDDDDLGVTDEELAYAAEHGMELPDFDIPDDPEALMAWLEMDGGFDLGVTEDAPATEPEPEPEPEPVAPPPPPKAEKKKKSGGMFGGDDEDLGVTDEELAYAAEHGMELPDFDIPDDPEALMAWLEMDGGFDLGVTEDTPAVEPEPAPEPEPEPVAPPPPPKAEKKKKSGGMFGGDDEDLGVTDEELAYAAEHGMELPDFDIPNDPEALMAWLEMDGGFDLGVTEDTPAVEPEPAPEPEPEPVAPPPPPKAEKKKKSGGMFGGDDEDLGVTDEELAYAAEHGMELPDFDIPDDPEALMAWLEMDSMGGSTAEPEPEAEETVTREAADPLAELELLATELEAEPEPEPEPVAPPPPPKAEKKKKSGGMFGGDDEDLGVTDEELAYAAEHGMELPDFDIPDDPEALMAWLEMDSMGGSSNTATAEPEATVTTGSLSDADLSDDLLAELEALALGDTTSLDGLLDVPDTTGDDALSWLDEAITNEDETDSLPSLLLPDDPDAALAMIEQEAEDDFPLVADDGVPTLDTLGFNDDLSLQSDEDLADFDLSLDADAGDLNDLFGDLGSGNDSLDWLNDVTFDSDPNLLGPVPTEFDLDSTEDFLSLPGLDDVPSDPDATFAMFEDMSALDTPSQPLIDDTADQMARSALEEIDSNNLGSEDIISLETGLTDSLPDWLSLEGDSSGLDWLDPSNDSNDLDWLSAVEEATRSTPDSANDFLDLYEPVDTSPSRSSSSSSSSRSSYTPSRRNEPAVPEPQVEVKEAFEPVDPAVYEGARASLSQGDVDSALGAYQEMLATKQNLRALAYELESVTMSNKHPLLQRFLGDVYMENGQLQKALNTYRKAQDLL